jgi:signal transduction histidine kinase
VVTNAVRHAAADNLWIEVSQSNGCARVQAWDDGEGAAEVRPGNGLAGMRERFEQLGGQVSFGSALGEGFRVEAVLPR